MFHNFLISICTKLHKLYICLSWSNKEHIKYYLINQIGYSIPNDIGKENLYQTVKENVSF